MNVNTNPYRTDFENAEALNRDENTEHMFKGEVLHKGAKRNHQVLTSLDTSTLPLEEKMAAKEGILSDHPNKRYCIKTSDSPSDSNSEDVGQQTSESLAQDFEDERLLQAYDLFLANGKADFVKNHSQPSSLG